MKKEQILKLELTIDLLKIIIRMAEQREDYTRILNEYNDFIELYDLPLLKIKYVDDTKFEFV